MTLAEIIEEMRECSLGKNHSVYEIEKWIAALKTIEHEMRMKSPQQDAAPYAEKYP